MLHRTSVNAYKKCSESDLFAWKSVIAYSDNNYYILSGIILSIVSILYPKWYKLIDLTELHNV